MFMEFGTDIPIGEAAIDQVILESRLDKLFFKKTQIMKKHFVRNFALRGRRLKCDPISNTQQERRVKTFQNKEISQT